MAVILKPKTPPIIILKFAIFVMTRNKAPRIQQKAEVSPILPGTSPKKSSARENPELESTAVIFSPSGARTDNAVAPLKPSTVFVAATHTSPDMETGYEKNKNALPVKAGFKKFRPVPPHRMKSPGPPAIRE